MIAPDPDDDPTPQLCGAPLQRTSPSWAREYHFCRRLALPGTDRCTIHTPGYRGNADRPPPFKEPTRLEADHLRRMAVQGVSRHLDPIGARALWAEWLERARRDAWWEKNVRKKPTETEADE